MLDGAGFSVHKILRPDDLPAERLTDRLVSEADAEDRDFAREMPDKLNANAGVGWRAGARRDHDLRGAQLFELRQIDLIVSADDNFLTQFAQVLDQVIGKGVVVI